MTSDNRLEHPIWKRRWLVRAFSVGSILSIGYCFFLSAWIFAGRAKHSPDSAHASQSIPTEVVVGIFNGPFFILAVVWLGILFGRKFGTQYLAWESARSYRRLAVIAGGVFAIYALFGIAVLALQLR